MKWEEGVESTSCSLVDNIAWLGFGKDSCQHETAAHLEPSPEQLSLFSTLNFCSTLLCPTSHPSTPNVSNVLLFPAPLSEEHAVSPEGVLVSSSGEARLESGVLDLSNEACLEFWYQTPAEAQGVDLRALLRDSAGQREMWTSPALGGDDWRQVFVPLITTDDTFAQVDDDDGDTHFHHYQPRALHCIKFRT